MLNVIQITRLIDAGEFHRVIQRVLRNGRCDCPEVEAVLSAEPVRQPAALGLALQRICELAYRPEPEVHSLAHQLRRCQQPDGLFGTATQLAVSAIAARALMAFADLTGVRSSIDAAVASALAAMEEMVLAPDASSEVSPLIARITLWQLGNGGLAAHNRALIARLRSLAAPRDDATDDLQRLAWAA